MTTYWSGTLMPLFREFLRDQFLCDLWFVCEGGAMVPCHRLMVTALLGEMDQLLPQDCQHCYVSLDGWTPEKLSQEIEHLYVSDQTELHSIFQRPSPMSSVVKTASKASDASVLFLASKRHMKMAKCPNCCKVFSVKYYKKYHERSCGNASATLECDICGKNSFVNKVTLSSHIRSAHSKEKPFECEYCKMKFSRSESLSKHRFRKHGKNKKGVSVENNFSCKICEKKLSSSEKLLQHVRVIHEGIRKYQCNFCDRQFSSRFNKDSHERKIHSLQEVVSNKCDKDSVQYVTHLEPVKMIPS